MNLIDALLGEHAVLYGLFEQFDQSAAHPNGSPSLRGIIATVTASLLAHAHVEDEILFPALEAHFGSMGPLAVMRAEHEKIEQTLQEAAQTEPDAEAAERVRSALAVAREHFTKEEQILFRMARQVLGEEALAQLAERWAARRRVAAS